MDGYDPDGILADPNAHPTYKRYAAINIGIRDRGEQWSKCANCGEPYQLTEQWDSATVCSETCGSEFTDSLMDGL